MGNRRLICISLMLAYIFVFAHSVIPHEHHCLHHEHVSHIHHFGNCEQLCTFIAEDGIQESDIAVQIADLTIEEVAVPTASLLSGTILFDTADRFVPAPPPPGRGTGLRAPPTV